MAHPYASHRQSIVEKGRVGKIAHGYATGGAAKHPDEAEDRKLVNRMLTEKGLGAVGGAKPKARMDKRARGGAVKGGKGTTNVNIVIAQKPDQDGAKPVPVPVPVPPPGPMAGPPPGAGMPPGAIPPGMAGPGGPPPGMPMRKAGGRVAKGTFDSSVKAGTQVTHSPGTIPDAPRGKPITFRSGGKVTHGKKAEREMESMEHEARRATGGGVVGTMRGGPKMRAGSESGEGRMEKAANQKRKG